MMAASDDTTPAVPEEMPFKPDFHLRVRERGMVLLTPSSGVGRLVLASIVELVPEEEDTLSGAPVPAEDVPEGGVLGVADEELNVLCGMEGTDPLSSGSFFGSADDMHQTIVLGNPKHEDELAEFSGSLGNMDGSDDLPRGRAGGPPERRGGRKRRRSRPI